eukprot:CAMPEP_0194545986 /NCGR_PEP_ID=MMETSP0253-20130528/89988_1 /TAXON_ID=2966 /ORGANISM="Noctiluca scintillans" /LENGTH=57 /DNA_ID=CAMNT_0039393033 /DNA_START=29 /DNA_END=202 /DNA_ORIENTATION=-
MTWMGGTMRYPAYNELDSGSSAPAQDDLQGSLDGRRAPPQLTNDSIRRKNMTILMLA